MGGWGHGFPPMQPQPALNDSEANMNTLVASDAVVWFLISFLNDFQCSVPAGYKKCLLLFHIFPRGFCSWRNGFQSFHQFRMRVGTLVFMEKNYTKSICEVNKRDGIVMHFIKNKSQCYYSSYIIRDGCLHVCQAMMIYRDCELVLFLTCIPSFTLTLTL